MNNKYLIIGGILFLLIAVGGVGFYAYGNQSDTSATLGAETNITNMSTADFQKAIQTGEYSLIDIRTAEEYATGHIKGASNTDFYQSQEFSNYLDSLDKNKKYLIYCRTGNRSGQALNIMKSKGFANVSDLDGGIVAWGAYGLPLEN